MFDIGFPRDWSPLKKLIWLKAIIGGGGAAGVWKTVTGALIHITDALASPMQKCEVSIEPQQSGTGDPSPENVRPITGWTGCEVKRTGKNLLENKFTSQTKNGVVFTVNSDGTITANGTASGSFVLAIYSKWPIEHLNGQEVFVSGAPAGSAVNKYRITLYYHNKNGGDLGYQTILESGAVMQIPTGAVDASVAIDFAKNTSASNIVFSPQIELGSQKTSYEPYSGTTLSVTFPDSAGTVYGGTLDVVSGELLVDMVGVDLGTLTYGASNNLSNSRIVYYFMNTIGMKMATTQSLMNVLSDRFEQIYENASAYGVNTMSGFPVDSSLRIPSNSFGFVVYTSEYPTANDFKTAMSGVQLVYELATPITYQLTPQQVSTLLGENNVWGSGDLEITYKAQE